MVSYIAGLGGGRLRAFWRTGRERVLLVWQSSVPCALPDRPEDGRDGDAGALLPASDESCGTDGGSAPDGDFLAHQAWRCDRNERDGSKKDRDRCPELRKNGGPSLCGECRKQLGGIFVRRYVLADLYSADRRILIPINDGLSMTVRCYELTAEETEEGILEVVIRGIPE